MKKRIRHLWLEWIKPFVIVLIVCCTFRSAIADWNVVPTGSMKPTILEGDRILVDKLAYGLRVPFTSWYVYDWTKPERNDVVVFASPEDGIRLVKRIIGLPGDRITMRSNQLYVNGVPAVYETIRNSTLDGFTDEERHDHRFTREQINGESHAVMVTPKRLARRNFGPLIVPEHKYFVMGDNRDNSRDSRWFGCVDSDLIFGQATSVVMSLDAENNYLPRTDRFFHSIE